ncbi:MAG: two-component system response regulator [Betaproteobacteria bacterium RIFCSPLOWO2_02_FULL_64_12]|nr:MAG: two-component system response regulator [Betaproteobacteria bacterium RIFCSPLOWO2_02_FULL_64_12]
MKVKERTLLLVEDNPDDLELTMRALKKSGFGDAIVVARDGVEAIDYLFGTGAYAGRDTRSQPAVILLDIKLPRLGGHEVLERLRKNRQTQLIPVVVLTSSDEREDIAGAYARGANSYIRKPVEFSQFSSVLAVLGRYWLELNTHVPPS